MANYELLALNPTTPQIVAPTAADTASLAGNLGLGVTPSAWLSGRYKYEFGSSGVSAGFVGAFNGSSGNLQNGLGTNCYHNASSVWVYSNTGAASLYEQLNNVHRWSIAPSGTAGNAITFTTVKNIDTSGHWLPGADNTQNLGSGALRMAVLYAGTGTINTSDAREKTPVTLLSAAEKAAAIELRAELGTFQFLDAVAEKGADKARHHVGMTVQRAIEIMESHGLSPFDYGFICHDVWYATTKEVVAEDGEFSREVERQVTVDEVSQVVEVVDGVPTLVEKVTKVPQYQDVQVVDSDGNPVAGMTHKMPLMETVTERYNVVTEREAGDRYSFRTDELALFMLAAI